jgi:hypothetical protein
MVRELKQLNESDEQDMLMAFSAENKLSLDFDWNRYYGHGFKVLNSVFTYEENK